MVKEASAAEVFFDANLFCVLKICCKFQSRRNKKLQLISRNERKNFFVVLECHVTFTDRSFSVSGFKIHFMNMQNFPSFYNDNKKIKLESVGGLPNHEKDFFLSSFNSLQFNASTLAQCCRRLKVYEFILNLLSQSQNTSLYSCAIRTRAVR